MAPIVTVITATRNRTELLARALRSVAAQTLAALEGIVVDDGSNESSQSFHRELASELGDRFRWLKPIAPGCPGTGPAAARNRGLAEARGAFVAFLDDDDEWTCQRHLETAVAVMEATRSDYFFANMEAHRDDETVLGTWFPNGGWLTCGECVGHDPAVFNVSLKSFLATMRHDLVHPDTTVVRRSLLAKTGGFVNRLSYSEDYNLMMRLADNAGGILYRPSVVARYRLPVGDSVSLTYSRLEEHLQRVFSAQHVRLHCSKAAVRRCARAREAWALREMAIEIDNESARWESTLLRLQSVAVYPTAGAMLELAKSFARATFGA